MIGELVSTTTRHWLIWWHWRLEYRHNDAIELIAQGAELSQKRARWASQSWQRIWLRQHGYLKQ